MDPLRRNEDRNINPDLMHDDPTPPQQGTFRGTGGNRDVASSSNSGGRAAERGSVSGKRPASSREENDPNEVKKQRLIEQARPSRGLTSDERKALSIGRKKANADGKRGKTSSVNELEKYYLKSKNVNPEAFAFCVRGYFSIVEVSLLHREAPETIVQNLAKQNARNHARDSRPLLNESVLRENFIRNHPEYGSNEALIQTYLDAYKYAYNNTHVAPEIIVQNLGKHNGHSQARDGRPLLDESVLRENFIKNHPEYGANEALIQIYLDTHKEAYNNTHVASEKVAQNLGRHNGYNQARDGRPLLDESVLRDNFIRNRPEYGGNEALIQIYLDAYKETYNNARVAPEKVAQNLGRHNGHNQAKIGRLLLDESVLRDNFIRNHPEYGANEDLIQTYLDAYKTAYNSSHVAPEIIIQNLGRHNGYGHAKSGRPLLDESVLRDNFIRNHPEHEGNEALIQIYLDAYKEAHNSTHVTPEIIIQNLGRHNGHSQAKIAGPLLDESVLRKNFIKNHPEHEGNEALIQTYLGAYKAGYNSIHIAPEIIVQNLGRHNGHSQAKNGGPLLHESVLRDNLIRNHPEYGGNEVFIRIYLDAYKEAYMRKK